jgi:hypothetical protein
MSPPGAERPIQPSSERTRAPGADQCVRDAHGVLLGRVTCDQAAAIVAAGLGTAVSRAGHVRLYPGIRAGAILGVANGRPDLCQMIRAEPERYDAFWAAERGTPNAVGRSAHGATGQQYDRTRAKISDE